LFNWDLEVQDLDSVNTTWAGLDLVDITVDLVDLMVDLVDIMVVIIDVF